MIDVSRKKRIARGAGKSLDDLNAFIKQFEQMKQMMKMMNKMPAGFGKGLTGGR
jgi:signal recognition particle subunit SRP54